MLFAPRSTRRAALLLTTAALGAGCLSLGSGALAPAPAAAAVLPAATTPTDQQVAEAQRAATESAARAKAAQDQLTGESSALDALASAASAALATFQQADEARQSAVTEEAAQRQRLAEAEAQLEAGRKDLGQWASQAYRGGGSLQEYSGLVTVLQQGATDDAASALATVKRLGDGRSKDVLEYQEAQRVQADATARAAEAAKNAVAYAEQAATAKQQADALVAQQRAKVAEIAALRAAAAGTATTDAERAANLAAAKQAADAATAAALAASSTGVIGAVGDCTGTVTGGYANGLIPRSALCPLWGAPNHVLRADAANAYQALSQAYAEEFGKPIAITDSYRTLAEQIDVKARKPGLAARPGTSRHGLGMAVDLGGGIQDAGSAEHAWMDRNAILYGWINPPWAQNRGGQFEPWHWEFVPSSAAR